MGKSKQNGNDDAFEFVECFYAHGITEGEVYSDGSKGLPMSRLVLAQHTLRPHKKTAH